MAHIKTTDADTYRYLNFDQLPEYVAKADQVCDVYGYFSSGKASLKRGV